MKAPRVVQREAVVQAQWWGAFSLTF
eukprot:SAG11_NODE_26813_length_340_cov_1.074689_1_plen_25_part_10